MVLVWYVDGICESLNLRCAKDTQWETQQIANRIDEEAEKLFPTSWKYLRYV